MCVWFIENRAYGKIGGDNLIVETNKSLFTKRNNNCGKQCVLVIGGGVGKRANVFQIPDRSFDTLIEAI